MKVQKIKKNQIRNFIANYELTKLVKSLKKLKLFAEERKSLNEILNHERFLVKNKLKYTAEDLEKHSEIKQKAYTIILSYVRNGK